MLKNACSVMGLKYWDVLWNTEKLPWIIGEVWLGCFWLFVVYRLQQNLNVVHVFVIGMNLDKDCFLK